MAKYYSMDEVQQKLSLKEERIRQLVETGQLRQYRDGGKIVFRADEVDALASKQDTGEISLEPVDEEGPEEPAAASGTGADVISLEEVDQMEKKGGTRAGAKDDTVITSVGISVFDEDEVPAAADPMAKTRISAQAEEQEVPMESVGSSGSGLLDLTRESDDTSLGAELLDEIYPEEEETVSEEPVVAAEAERGAPAAYVAAEPAVAVLPAVAADPFGPAFTGLLVISVVMLGLVGVVSAAVAQDVWPSFLDVLYRNSLFFLAGAVVLAGIALLIGWLVGKRAGQPVRPPQQAK
jgi:excisionase family DNA binding protein